MGLEDYKDTVATCATISGMIQMLAGTLICKDLHRKGTTEGCDPMPFMGGIGMSIMMLRYGWMLGDSAMINTSAFGLFANMLYMTVYYYYSPDTTKPLALLGKILALVAVLLIYVEFEDPEEIHFRFGLIVTVLLMLLIGSPLIHLKEIIRTKDTGILPFPLIFMGTIVSFQWLLYGLIIQNSFVIFQNVVAFTLSLAQMSLFLVYPSSPTSLQKKKS